MPHLYAGVDLMQATTSSSEGVTQQTHCAACLKEAYVQNRP